MAAPSPTWGSATRAAACQGSHSIENIVLIEFQLIDTSKSLPQQETESKMNLKLIFEPLLKLKIFN